MTLKTVQAFSDYIYNSYEFEQQYVVLNYAEEIDIEEAKQAAAVFAGNGINCYLFEIPASEEKMLEAVGKLECPAGFWIGKDGFRFYDINGVMPREAAEKMISEAEKLTDEDIVSSDFGVSFSFMRIMYIKP